MSQDPTPGDPEEIRRLADRYRQIGQQAETANRILGSGGAVEQGSGKAIDALRKQLKSLPDKLGKTAQSFSEAASAYETYAKQLEDAQSTVDRAMDQAGPVAGTAGQTAPTLAPDATAEQKADAGRQQDGIDAAQQTMSAAKRLAEDARNLREQASQRAGQELDDAASKAIPERGFFQKIADFFADFPFVKILLDILIAVVAVFFPVAGFILGAALFAFQTAQQIATGDFKLGDFAAGLFALVPGGSLIKLGGRAATVVGSKIAPTLVKGASESGGFISTASGSITKFTETITNSKAVSVVFKSPAGSVATGAVGEFGQKVAEEAVVKTLNGDEITPGNLLAGAAAGAVVGAGFKGVSAARKGEFSGGGAFNPPPRPPAGAAAKPDAPPPTSLRDKAVDQGTGLIQEGASAGTKVGVAVSEGADPKDALLSEASNFLPGAVGSVGKRGASQGLDSFIPIKGTPPPGISGSPAPSATPDLTPPASPAPVVTPNTTPDSTPAASATPDSAPAASATQDSTPPASPTLSTTPDSSATSDSTPDSTPAASATPDSTTSASPASDSTASPTLSATPDSSATSDSAPDSAPSASPAPAPTPAASLDSTLSPAPAPEAASSAPVSAPPTPTSASVSAPKVPAPTSVPVSQTPAPASAATDQVSPAATEPQNIPLPPSPTAT
ncbi:putative T7SS-secreted protein [Streptosporangium subroseum]|uniref:putative T7SS-secreted protein n=1 Tax=Streptosporangium subroseum TaxID=106412 RepID=UPI00341D9F4C